MTYFISILLGLLLGFILDGLVKLYKGKQEKINLEYDGTLTYNQKQFNKIVKKREEDLKDERFIK